MAQDSVKIADYPLHELMKTIIYGVATGDALGFPMQFHRRTQAQKYPIVEMGKQRLPNGNISSYPAEITGLWSDDTSLTLCLAESFVLGYSLKDMAFRNYAWLHEGHLSARDQAFDVGAQTIKGINHAYSLVFEREDELALLIHQNIESANGNGALMRILPLLIFTYGLELDEAFKYVKEVSALTHPHLRSAYACLYYLKFAERILDKEPKTEAFTKTQAEMRDFAPSAGLSERDMAEFQRLFHSDICTLETEPSLQNSADYLHSSGYVIHSLEAALYCILTCENYRDTVLKAVFLGEDTDTTAAITGGLAAILYGFADIPQDWINLLQSPDKIEHVLDLYLMF